MFGRIKKILKYGLLILLLMLSVLMFGIVYSTALLFIAFLIKKGCESNGWKRHASLVSAVILFGILPAIGVFISTFVAGQLNCPLHEGGVNSCMLGVFDIGEGLYTLFVGGWFMLLTFPIGSLILLAYLMSNGVKYLTYLWNRERNKSANNDPEE